MKTMCICIEVSVWTSKQLGLSTLDLVCSINYYHVYSLLKIASDRKFVKTWLAFPDKIIGPVGSVPTSEITEKRANLRQLLVSMIEPM